MTIEATALADAAVAAGRRPRAPLWMLALFAFSATLGMHVFVPALPNAAHDLGVGAGAMQMTVSLYILGLAIGQLVYGPLSDRFGRRRVLMAGLALFTVAGFAAAFAPGVDALIAARLLQALGGCSGLVLARAIVRDTAATREAARRLALMNLMVTLGPGLAPLVGGALAEATGWRSIFLLLTALGVANLYFAWRLLEETAPETSSVSVSTLAGDYLGLLRSPAFLGYSIGGGCATTSVYAFLAAAPFIFIDELHRPSREVGLYLALLVSGIWLGSVLASRLISRISLKRLLIGANAVGCVAALALLAIVLSGRLGVALTIGVMFVFCVGVGVAAPVALTQAISVKPRVVGSASGLYGFAQMAVGAVCTALAGLGADAALSAALVLAGASLIGQASFWIAARRAKASGPAAA
jgi:DHA1 family bicyclomycin/chloramphenicol resistance-like MFS transporter